MVPRRMLVSSIHAKLTQELRCMSCDYANLLNIFGFVQAQFAKVSLFSPLHSLPFGGELQKH